ncbi:hypothetical protein EST54_05535 [Streptomyces sioyaensis]|uniref:Uncharacterized protein n=1 Tax=Streptomyces sioyaensis TaxID=67364 RepID=A0A4Q1R7V8_9ACTN|nr:hypothetical protein EST54_05535 [Streptomyces sioyaensis]
MGDVDAQFGDAAADVCLIAADRIDAKTAHDLGDAVRAGHQFAESRLGVAYAGGREVGGVDACFEELGA